MITDRKLAEVAAARAAARAKYDADVAAEKAERAAEIDEMIAEARSSIERLERDMAEIAYNVVVANTLRYPDDRRGAKQWARHKRDAEFARAMIAELEKRKAKL